MCFARGIEKVLSYVHPVRSGRGVFVRGVAVFGVALVAFSLAACSQSKTTNRTATAAAGGISSGSSADYQQAILQWTQCMRANGVPNFPDPDAKGRFLIDRTKIDVNSQAFISARRSCQDKFPAGIQSPSARADSDLLNQMLAYARCMRANGVPNFPDPQVVNGRPTLTLPPGIDQNSEAFIKAQNACNTKVPAGIGG